MSRVTRYVLYFSGAVFFPTITPSLTDHRSSYPSQASSVLPSNSLIVWFLPTLGGTTGASCLGAGFLSCPSARPAASRTAKAASVRMVRLGKGGAGGADGRHP